MNINYDSLNACTMLLPFVKVTNIALVGCGGTGSWLAPHLARICRILEEVHSHKTNLVFWDPDQVEQKNIFRQNFCEAEIGCNKATALAARYSYAWGLDIVAREEPVDSNPFGNLGTYGTRSIVITCVDNNTARAKVHKYAKSDYDSWWMDTGNLKTAGQIAVGKMRKKNDLVFLGNTTTWSPLPSFQFPQILKEEKTIKVKVKDMKDMSCAEMLMVDEQGLMINQLIASMAASMLLSLLVLGDLRFHCAYVSEIGTQVVYNTPEILEKYAKEIK